MVTEAIRRSDELRKEIRTEIKKTIKESPFVKRLMRLTGRIELLPDEDIKGKNRLAWLN